MSQSVEQAGTGRPVDPDFDPLAPDYLADPYPYYARFRKDAPVFYAPKVDFWVVSRYEDIVRIVKDPETFSNKRVQEPLQPLTPEALEQLKKGVRVTPTTSTADPPLRTRKHAARAFSANRDESVFENPDEFDIRRQNASKHIAFSHGIHFCLGAPLARLEARVAFELLTRRLPDLRLSPPDQELEFDPNISFRGPKELWAEWTPAEAASGAR